MREYKFRAWIQKYPELSEWYMIKFDFFDVRGLYIKNDYELRQPLSANHIMQYTGLKDKNGTEIWEGDLAKDHSPHITDAESIGEVKYKNEEPGFFLEYDEEWWTMHSNDIEVIGNIYENPELLS